jgi:phosphoesterase RecJ-like protein
MAEITVELEGRFAWLYVSQRMLAETGSGEAEVDGLIEYLRLLRGVNLSVLLLQVDDTMVKASFRSEEAIDVNRLAALWGGGGHVHAAGATVAGPVENTVREIVERARLFVT